MEASPESPSPRSSIKAIGAGKKNSSTIYSILNWYCHAYHAETQTAFSLLLEEVLGSEIFFNVDRSATTQATDEHIPLEINLWRF